MRLATLFALALLCWAASAPAVGDQGPDMLGWYFDTDAEFWAADVWPGSPIQAYLILTHPTVGEIVGWEASFAIDGTALLLETEVYHEGTNSLDGQDFAVTYATPLACEGPTALAAITLLPYEVSDNCITLYSVEDPAVPGELPVLYLPDGQYLQAEICRFEDSNASAWLGELFGIGTTDDIIYPCEGIVPDQEFSWSTVKELFD